MHCLVVKAHPLTESLCASLTDTAVSALQTTGHEVVLEDLYAEAFAPALMPAERASYYTETYAAEAVTAQTERLLNAEALVLVFPTWWFGFPAILKGWFDRIWAPGIAYDHAPDLGAIRPRLHNLRHVLAITTLGSPWWVDNLIMGRPVKRTLKTALIGTCAPQARFEILSLYRAEKLEQPRIGRFRARIANALSAWGRGGMPDEIKLVGKTRRQ